MTRSLALLPLLAVIAACSEPQKAELTDEEFATMADGVPVPVPENPEAKAVSVTEEDELARFVFAYPAEAAAIAKLKALLDQRLAKARADIRDTAEAEKRIRQETGGPFNGLFSSSLYDVWGNSHRLLSLLGEIETYTGGAHGNRGTVALLWDRVLEKPIDATMLFGDATVRDAVLKDAFCKKLEAERRRRVGTVPDDSMFANCPTLDSITIVPFDDDKDAKFDHLVLFADPYVAGAYAEGTYQISLPVDRAIGAAIVDPYRSEFGQ